MKKFYIILIVGVSAVIGFFIGSSVTNNDIYKAAENHPRGGLNIPAQWFMMKTLVGWEEMMLVFGYADNIDVCEHLVNVAKIDSPDREFRCIDAN